MAEVADIRMREMRDSSAHRLDAALMRARIDQDGYLFVRGLLDRDKVRAVAAEILAVLQEAGWLSPGPRPEEAGVVQLTGGRDDPRYWTGFAAVQGLESFHQLAYEPGLVDLMRHVVGADAYCYPSKSPYVMFPEAAGGRNAEPHQEAIVMPWPRYVYSTWVALAEVPVENGGLAVLPGSHTHGALGKDVPPFAHDWVVTDYLPGDVVIFDNHTVHGSLPNRTDRLRLSCSFKWQSAGTPAPISVVLPALYPRVPHWEVLTAGWSSTKWIQMPPQAKVGY